MSALTDAALFSSSSATEEETQTLPIGLKYVDKDLANTNATGIPTIVQKSKAIWMTVTKLVRIPKGRYNIKTTIPKTFIKGDLLFPALLSGIILLENGVNRNLECCRSPSPIGIPINVAIKIKPKIAVNNEVTNPKNGKCQRMFPNVFILSLFKTLFNQITTNWVIGIYSQCNESIYQTQYTSLTNLTPKKVTNVTAYLTSKEQ